MKIMKYHNRITIIVAILNLLLLPVSCINVLDENKNMNKLIDIFSKYKVEKATVFIAKVKSENLMQTQVSENLIFIQVEILLCT